jgi:hypothetical protein
VVLVTQAFVGSEGLLAIPLGYTAGVIAKDVLLAIFLAPRIRQVGRATRREPGLSEP